MEDSKGEDQSKVESHSSAQSLSSLEESSCALSGTALRRVGLGFVSLLDVLFPSVHLSFLFLGALSLLVISFSFISPLVHSYFESNKIFTLPKSSFFF